MTLGRHGLLAVAVMLVVAACGEFSNEAYLPVDTDTVPMDVLVETVPQPETIPLDTFAPDTLCPEGTTPLTITTSELPPATVGTIYRTTLEASPAPPDEVEWVFMEGSYKDSDLFILDGGVLEWRVPTSAAEPDKDLFLKLKATAAFGTCWKSSEAVVLPLTILEGCKKSDECPDLDAAGWTATCNPDSEGCQATPTTCTNGQASRAIIVSSTPHLFDTVTVTAHHQTSAFESPYPTYIQLQSTTDTGSVTTMDYSLPNDVIIPLAPGDDAVVSFHQDGTDSTYLAIYDTTGDLLFMAYDGPEVGGGFLEVCNRDTPCPLASLESILTTCTAFSMVGCGQARQSLLEVVTASGSKITAIPDANQKHAVEVDNVEAALVIGEASQYPKKVFDCVEPYQWSSLFVYSTAACPTAAIDGGTSALLSEPNEQYVLLASSPSSLPDGPLHYSWTIEGPATNHHLSEYEGVKLLVPIQAVGDYTISLTTTTETGETSCIPAIHEVSLRPTSDLYAEVSWEPVEPDAPLPNLSLQLVNPFFYTELDIEKEFLHFVCDEDNPTPDWGVPGDSSDDPTHYLGSGEGGVEAVSFDNPQPLSYQIAVVHRGGEDAPPVNATITILSGGEVIYSTVVPGLEPGEQWDGVSIQWPSGTITEVE